MTISNLLNAIIPLSLSAIIWAFLTFVSVYVYQHERLLTRMIAWLRKQHGLLEDHPAYSKEAYEIYNVYIPGMQQWLFEDQKFQSSILLAQGFNVWLATQFLFGTASFVLIVAVAVAVAIVGVGWKLIQNRRYTAEGTCQTVQASVETLQKGEV